MNQPTLNRRSFQLHCLAAAGALVVNPSAHAQGGPTEGRQYRRLPEPLPMPAGAKIEVVEFFWYGCPHCYALEPQVEAWSAKLPADVNFRRVPAGFNPQYEFHQRVFYALEAMGALPAVHRKLFDAIHQQKKRLSTEADMAAFLATVGVDAAKFSDMLKSFAVLGKVRQATNLSNAYRIDGVPSLGVHGRYLTSPSMAGGPEQALAVVDHLVGSVRSSAH